MSRSKEQFEQWQQEQRDLEHVDAVSQWEYTVRDYDNRVVVVVPKNQLTDKDKEAL